METRGLVVLTCGSFCGQNCGYVLLLSTQLHLQVIHESFEPAPSSPAVC